MTNPNPAPVSTGAPTTNPADEQVPWWQVLILAFFVLITMTLLDGVLPFLKPIVHFAWGTIIIVPIGTVLALRAVMAFVTYEPPSKATDAFFLQASLNEAPDEGADDEIKKQYRWHYLGGIIPCLKIDADMEVWREAPLFADPDKMIGYGCREKMILWNGTVLEGRILSWGLYVFHIPVLAPIKYLIDKSGEIEDAETGGTEIMVSGPDQTYGVNVITAIRLAGIGKGVIITDWKLFMHSALSILIGLQKDFGNNTKAFTKEAVTRALAGHMTADVRDHKKVKLEKRFDDSGLEKADDAKHEPGDKVTEEYVPMNEGISTLFERYAARKHIIVHAVLSLTGVTKDPIMEARQAAAVAGETAKATVPSQIAVLEAEGERNAAPFVAGAEALEHLADHVFDRMGMPRHADATPPVATPATATDPAPVAAVAPPAQTPSASPRRGPQRRRRIVIPDDSNK